MVKKIDMMARFVVVFLLAMVVIGCNCAKFYRAAVYEHKPIFDSDKSQLQVLQLNLDAYLRAIKTAAGSGAKIIVFPEYGLTLSLKLNRENLAPYFPLSPASGFEVDLVPCTSMDYNEENLALIRLSCSAKYNKIVVVYNFGTRVPCFHSMDSNCPEDGFYLYNTDVVLGSNGQVLTTYYKKHLFGENYFNSPESFQFKTFSTEFGKFGIFICYDILFEEAAKIARNYSVDTVVYSTHWYDQYPIGLATQVQAAFARTHNINLLAANCYQPRYTILGSGIYAGRHGSVNVTTYSSKNSSLLISDIPINPKTSRYVPESYHENNPSDTSKYWPFKFPLNSVKFVQLDKPAASMNLTHRGLTCNLNFETKNNTVPEGYYFGAYSGILQNLPQNPLAFQMCLLINDPYSKMGRNSRIAFDNFKLSGKFSESALFGMVPSVLTNDHSLAPPHQWSYDDGTIQNVGVMDRPLKVVSLTGRDFANDI